MLAKKLEKAARAHRLWISSMIEGGAYSEWGIGIGNRGVVQQGAMPTLVEVG